MGHGQQSVDQCQPPAAAAARRCAPAAPRSRPRPAPSKCRWSAVVVRSPSAPFPISPFPSAVAGVDCGFLCRRRPSAPQDCASIATGRLMNRRGPRSGRAQKRGVTFSGRPFVLAPFDALTQLSTPMRRCAARLSRPRGTAPGGCERARAILFFFRRGFLHARTRPARPTLHHSASVRLARPLASRSVNTRSNPSPCTSFSRA